MTPRILIIEDDEALRNAVRAILDHAGYEVTIARDGAAGTRALSSGTFDVILLDLGLPFVDGWQILRNLEPGRMPTVIVISARGGERDKVRALDMGADDYLAKPFGAEELLARIRVVLRRASGLDAARMRALVEKHVQGRVLWIFGEPHVNVLDVNMALDRGEAG